MEILYEQRAVNQEMMNTMAMFQEAITDFRSFLSMLRDTMSTHPTYHFNPNGFHPNMP